MKSLTNVNIGAKYIAVKSMNTKRRLGLAWVFLIALALPMPSSVGASVSLGSLTLTKVYPRIFTPNGDGYNDKARFEFDNPELLPVTGAIYDISGARVADLKTGIDPNSVLLWDGKDNDGQVVAGGMYVYDVVFAGKHATGTVVVAR